MAGSARRLCPGRDRRAPGAEDGAFIEAVRTGEIALLKAAAQVKRRAELITALRLRLARGSGRRWPHARRRHGF